MNNIKSTNNIIAKNAIILSIRMMFTLVVSLYTTKVVLNTLGIIDFGIYNVVCGFVAMFSFLTTSMSNGIQRFYNYEYGKNGSVGIRKVYNVALVIQFAVMFITILLGETIGVWYINNEMIIPAERLSAALWVFQSAIVSFSFSIIQVPYMASIMAHEKMDYYAYVSIFDVVLKLAIAIGLPYYEADTLIFYGILTMLISVVNFFLYVVYCKIKFREMTLFRPSLALLKSMVGFSGWNVLGTFANMLREQGLNIILNLFFGTVVNAARGIAYQVLAALQGFIQNIGIAVRPQLVQAYAQGDVHRTIRLMYGMSKLSFIFLYIMSYPIIIEIDYILHLWLGSNVPEYTPVFLRLVIIISVINNLNAAVSAVVHATGKMRMYQTTGALSTILVIPCSYFYLQYGGPAESVFYISILFAIIMQIVALFVLRTLITFCIKDYIRRLMRPLTIIVITTFYIPLIPNYFMSEGFFRLVVVGFSTIIACGVSTFIWGLDPTEKKIATAFVQKYVHYGIKKEY